MNESNDEIEFDILSEPKAGYRPTYPIEFSGRRCWLTDEEMNHLRLIQQYFPNNWETEVCKHMDNLSLGDMKQDLYLHSKINQAVT
jgi:hypothetical protein